MGLLSIPASGANLSWSGGGGANANWNNSANWGGAGTPANGDTLIFQGPQPNLLNTNNIASLTLNQIRFQGTSGGFDLRGNAFTLTNNIECTNSAGVVNTIENDITLATKDQILDVTISLTMAGALSGSVGVNKNGAGTMRYQGTGNNTYTGTTTVNAGLLELFKTGGGITAIAGDLVISGTVRHLAGTEIANTAAVTVNSGGLLDLNGSSDIIGNSLTLNGNAAITTGGGTLTLSPNATITANLDTFFVGNASISGNLNVGSGACSIVVIPAFFLTASFVIPATIGGSAAITKTGAGFMSLSGANSFSGQMNVADGTVGISNPLALGTTAAGTTVSNTATLQISTSVTNEALTVASTGIGLINASGANTWVSPINLAAATTLEIDGVSLDVQGLITGSGGFTKTGAGTLTLSGSGENTYSGATVVNIGTLELNHSSGHSIRSSSSLTIGDGVGGTDVDIVRYINSNGNQIQGGISITINSSGLLDLNGHSDDIGPFTISGGDISTGSGQVTADFGNINVLASASKEPGITGHIQMFGNTITVDNGAAFRDLKIPASISDNGNGFQIVSGAAPGAFVLLQASNSFSGPLTISGVTMDVETPWSLGTTNGGTIVTNNGELFIYSTDITNETVTLATGATMTAQYDCSWNGPVILSGDATINGFTLPGLFDITGPISGTGNLTSTANQCTNRFSGLQANTYSGLTTVSNGTLELNKTGFDSDIPHDLVVSGTVRLLKLNQIPNTANVTINTTGLLDINNTLDGIGSLDMTGGAVTTGSGYLELIGAGGGIATHASSVQAGISGILDLGAFVRTFNIGSGSASPDLLVSAVIRNGGVTKVGNGNVRFSGANTYAGLTTISNAFIQVANATGLGATTAGTVMSGGSLLVEGVSVSGEPLTNNSASSLFESTGSAGWSGNVVLNAQLDILPFGGGGTLDVSGAISGSGAVTVGQTGTLIYSGGSANTYSGLTTVSSGATLLLNKTAFNDWAIAGDLDIFGTVRLAAIGQIVNSADVLIESGGLFDCGVFNDQIDTLRGPGNMTFAVNGWIEVGLNNGSSTYNGVMSGTGYTAGGYTVAKRGSGTFIMNGNNTFTAGATHVFDTGKLIINGSQPQVPAIVDSFATLGGSGTVGNIAANGNIAPGNSPGLLTSSNIVFTSTGDYFVELTGPNVGADYDQLNVRGTNVLGNALLHVTPAFTTPVAIGQSFTILNNDLADAITGTFNGLAQGAAISAGGYKFTISYIGGSGNDVVLTLTDVPGAAVSAVVSSGDGNHAIDPNDCNDLNLVISNQTASAMNNVTAVLSTTTEGVIISQPYSAYPNIAANGKGTNTTPFQISTLPSFICGTTINLQLSVDSSLGSFITTSTLNTGGPAAVPVRFDNNTVTNVPDVGTIESTNIVASWSGGPITKVAVSLWLVAPFDSDMNLTLIAPDGTPVDLSSGNGAGANFGTGNADGSRTTFDDAAGTSITAGAPPFVGSFRPEVALSTLAGTAPVGTWRLRIQDLFGSGNVDTLRAWSLFLYGTSCSSGGGACDFCLSAISGAITASDPLQTNRWFRNFISPASCGSPMAWPGFGGVLTNYHYDAYTFTNTSGADACVTVVLQSAGDVMAAAYLNSFDPTTISNNFLGDADFSTAGGTTTFSCNVPAGARFVVAVNEATAFAGTQPYTLQLSGLPCPPPTIFIDPLIPAPAVRVHWPTWAGGFKLEATPSLAPTNWTFVTNEPIVTGLQFNVTNSPPPTNRFYRLHKP